MLWVLLLFCVKQALRIDEALNLKYKDFMVDYFIVKHRKKGVLRD